MGLIDTILQEARMSILFKPAHSTRPAPGKHLITASLIHRLRGFPAFMRSTAALVLVTFTLMILQPTIAAAQAAKHAKPTPASRPAHNLLDELRATTLRMKAKSERGEKRDDDEQRLLQHTDELDEEEQQAEADFQAIKQHLDDHGLPEEIKERHRQTVADYHAKMNALKARLSEFRKVHSKKDHNHKQRALNDLADFLQKEQKIRPRPPFDPDNLPFRTPDDKVRAPKEKKEELDKIVRVNKPVQVAAAELTPEMLAQADPTPSAMPTPDDLAQNEDVQITQAIRNQAAALHHNPVEIYNWVHNSIEFLPTYGSIQGSDLTLQAKRGNAFDTASLLIALLRASDIPARYAYGTIQVPAEQVMNWVGGVKTPEAAQSLLGQGGIPSVALVSGGKIAAFKLEHIWVEAFVDFIPSRGAIHRIGDTWVPLDASFKQYSYTDGMDLNTAVPFDAQGLIDQLQAGAAINEAEGWVQNIDQNLIQQTLADYQNQIKTYIDSQKPEATIIDALEIKQIIGQNLSILAGTLPYQTIVIGSRFSQMPNNLRWQISLNLYESELDKAIQAPQFTVALSLSKLGMGRLSASYIPASEADAQVIQSYATANHLPVYLVNEILRIQIDNTVLAEYHAQTMGAPQYWTYTLTRPGGNAVEEDFKLASAVGDQIVFSINGAGVSLDQVSARYQSVDPNSSMENLNHLAIGYWARADISDAVIANQFKTIAYRLPSVGMFAHPLSVTYAWGIPKFGSYKSYAIDIRRLITSAVTVDGKAAANFRFQSGLSSSQLEGRIFEEIFDLAPGNGFSAVAVLATAIRNGVPIWKLDVNNLQSFLSVSILSGEVKDQIANAVSEGLIVITPEEGIDAGFWAGQGYVAVDPQTGAGAYMLNSTNGGEFVDCEESSQPLTQSIPQQILTFTAFALAAILIATGEISSGGLATPAIILAMGMVGISALTWSSTSYAAGKCKSNEKCHRGSIQAQGRDIQGPGKGNSRTKSAPWAQPTPLTLAQGLSKLEELKLQLTPEELSPRIAYFANAEAYMRNAALSGGICAGPDTKKSFGPNKNIKDHYDKGIRVDVNVNAGEAFIP
jgi:transglutaminase-like putative cysteine protease